MLVLNVARVSAQRWYGRLIRWPLRCLPPGMTVRVLRGPLRGAKWIIGSHTHGCWVGTYEALRQRALERLVTPGMVIYDLGANVGFYALLAARLVGPSGIVVAFEPVPRNLGYLRRHIALNRCVNVQIIEAAVSDEVGERRMQADFGATARLSDDGRLVVRSVVIDRLVFEGGLRAPSLMKIDVEGEELRVLLGARRTLVEHRPLVLLSTHSEALRRECHRRLQELDYRLEPEQPGLNVAATDEVIAVPGARRP